MSVRQGLKINQLKGVFLELFLKEVFSWFVCECSKCRFKSCVDEIHTKVESSEHVGSNIVFVVESPDKLQVLDKLVRNIGLKANSYVIEYALNCPTGDKALTEKDLIRCNTTVRTRLKLNSPDYVFLIGRAAVRAVLGELNNPSTRASTNIKMSKIEGKVIKKDDTIYIAATAPHEKCFDFEVFNSIASKLVFLVSGVTKRPLVAYKTVETEKDLQDVLNLIESNKVAIDIETNSLSPFFETAEILSISITPKEGVSYVIPMSWPTNAYFKKWSYKPKINVFSAIIWLKDLLEDDSIVKIFHNAQFDVMFMEHILDTKVSNYTCTMLKQYVLDPEAPKGLKFLAEEHLHFPDWEFDIELYKSEDGSFTSIPPDKLFLYNAHDTDATIRLNKIFDKRLIEQGQTYLLNNLVIPNTRGLIEIMKTGMSVDYSKCAQVKETYIQEIAEYTVKILDIPEVGEFESLVGEKFNPGSSRHKMAIAYGGEFKVTERVCTGVYKNGRPKYKTINKEVVVNGFGLEPVGIYNKIKGEERPSLSRVAVRRLLKRYYTGIEYMEPLETGNLDVLPVVHPIVPFLNFLGKINTRNTQLSNHIVPFLNYWSKSYDSKVHTSYNSAVTRTGRLCIAEDTLIEVVRDVSKYSKGIPVQDVKAEDLVYSYNNANKLCLKKVKWAGITGYKKCVKLKWLGQRHHTKGELILTGNHRVRLTDGTWKKAKNLISGDELVALSRDVTSHGYARLYPYGDEELQEHSFIFSYLKGERGTNNSIHHVDGVKLNNSPENLKAMSKLERHKLHFSKNNHVVMSIGDAGYYNVYDLEVEGTHCFIANEICVHNSSSSPNLQNIAREGETRGVFKSRFGDEGMLLELDYKQLELFILAIISKDPKLTHAFKNGVDVHTETATNIVFKCKAMDVTKEMRTSAKKVSFGIVYGKGAKTLGDDINVPEEEAQIILCNWYNEYSGVKNWMDETIRSCRRHGYVETLTGRRRYLEDNGSEMERKAVNTPIQGSASDVCVKAINLLVEQFQDLQKHVVVCGTVHDSIWFDCKKFVANKVAAMGKHIMENTGFSWLTIPLQVDVKYGPNFKDMAELKEGESIDVNHKVFNKGVSA